MSSFICSGSDAGVLLLTFDPYGGRSGALRSGEPGIHTPGPWLRIPGSLAALGPRNAPTNGWSQYTNLHHLPFVIGVLTALSSGRNQQTGETHAGNRRG